MRKKTRKLETEKNNLSYDHCLNCGAELNGKYCHVCGQQAINKIPTVGGFIIEYINHAFIWDSKFLRTIWLLVRRPGYLTNEFLSGKFVSQEHPLKLNMFLLFVFVTLFLFFSNTNKLDITTDDRIFPAIQVSSLINDEVYAEKIMNGPRDTVLLSAPLVLGEDYSDFITNLEVIEDIQGESLDTWKAVIPHVFIEEKFVVQHPDGYYHFNKEQEHEDATIIKLIWVKTVSVITQYFPMLILFTAPFVTFSIRLLQRKNKRPRIHHFIFSLHYTAFLELLITFIYIAYLIASPSKSVLEWVLILGSCTYLTLAFREVYGVNSWFKSIVKSILTSMLYFLIILFVIIAILFTSTIAVVYSVMS